MKLEKFKEKNKKKIGIILFTITCILLITGLILYRTFAIFETNDEFNVINGSVEDPGNIYFAFYKDGVIQKEMPRKEEGYVLDESQSYCGVLGNKNPDIKVSMTDDETIKIKGVTTSRTKCNLYFVKGAYILGKAIPVVTEGDGLFEVTHDNVSGTLNDEGFKTTEYRYAGQNPDNYITFNNETWRIIGLVNVMTSEKNVEQRVKIVRNETFSEVYNTIQSNDWTEASLMRTLNEGDYYTRKGDYTQTGLQENAKLMIEKVFWNLGAPDAKQSPTVEEHYVQERWNVTIDICSNNTCDTYEKGSNEILWEGLIALRYVTDFFYATGGKNRNDCLNINIYSPLSETCLEYNWAKTSSDFELLLSPTVIIEGYAYVNELRTNYVAKAHHAVSYKSDFKPTLYLKKDVKISSGTGNVNDAYKLKYEIS